MSSLTYTDPRLAGEYWRGLDDRFYLLVMPVGCDWLIADMGSGSEQTEAYTSPVSLIPAHELSVGVFRVAREHCFDWVSFDEFVSVLFGDK